MPIGPAPLPAVEGLGEHVNRAHARQAHRERLVVGIAEGHQPRPAVTGKDVHSLADHGPLDAAAGHRPGHLAAVVDDHRGPRVAWARTLEAHHPGHRNAVSRRLPTVDVVENVLHGTTSTVASAGPFWAAHPAIARMTSAN